MKQIIVENISKSYKVHLKSETLRETLKSFLKRKYVSTEAVKKVSFEVESGEILGLIGLNGAGKTTIIKMVSGVIKPDHGRIEILNSNPFKKSIEYRKNVALIMGNKGQLDYDVSILDSIILYAAIYGIPKNIALERVREMAEELGLSDQDLKKQVRSLSLGQRMKGEIILSFLHLPKIVFLDEPTLGLDFVTQRKIREYLKKYKEKYGASIILTSHYIEDIENMCDNILIINKGEEIYYGSINGLKERRSNHKKLSFVGTREILERIREAFPDEKIYYENNKVIVKAEEKVIPEIIKMIFSSKDYKDLNIEEDNLNNVIESLYEESVVS